MTDPATHYHRIDTADQLSNKETGVTVRPDTEYLLTRVRGQLKRIHALSNPGDPFWPLEIRAAVSEAEKFLALLEVNLKDTNHYDVI